MYTKEDRKVEREYAATEKAVRALTALFMVTSFDPILRSQYVSVLESLQYRLYILHNQIHIIVEDL